MHGQRNAREIDLDASSNRCGRLLRRTRTRRRTEISLGIFSLYLAASAHGLAGMVMPSWASRGGGA